MSIKVRVDKRLDAPEPEQMDLEALIKLAGWNEDDPGVGRAVLAPDGSEIISPLKFSEPADIEAGQDMMAVMEQRILQKLRAGLFTGEESVDETDADASDFDVPDDINYVSGFEVELATEYPAAPPPAVRPGRDPLVESEAELAAAEAELDLLDKRVSEARARRDSARAAKDISPASDVEDVPDANPLPSLSQRAVSARSAEAGSRSRPKSDSVP